MKQPIVQRGKKKTYYLYRRVPARYASVDQRTYVNISLKTDSHDQASKKATIIWHELEEAWEAKLAGDTDDAELRFAAARELADKRGFRYMPATQVAALPYDELVKRLETVRKDTAKNGTADQKTAAAVLGGADEPAITVSRALEIYWTLTDDKTLKKSEDQLRRWKNPRIKAVKNFVEVVGDKPIAKITADDMLDFRAWWVNRVASQGMTANSANKDLVHLGDVLKTVNKMKRLNLRSC